MKPIYTLLVLSLLMAQPAAAVKFLKLPHRHKSEKTATAPEEKKETAPEKKAEAPEKPEKSPEKEASLTGPTAFVFVAGTNSNLGAVVSYNVNVGYNVTPKIGVDGGFNLYTTRTPFSIITTKDWRTTTILGAPYLDVRYTTDWNTIKLTSIATVSGGLSSLRTYSTGRAIGDWYNHAEHVLQITDGLALTPFVNFGFASGTMDRTVMASPYNTARPYQTLGGMGSGEAGGSFTVANHYKVGASAWGLQPVGPQKVYSRLVSPDSLLAGDGAHGRYWDRYFLTEGPSKIARDNGYSAWLEVSRFHNLTVEFAYTRSIHYDYGAAFVMIKYDLTSILRNLTIGE